MAGGVRDESGHLMAREFSGRALADCHSPCEDRDQNNAHNTETTEDDPQHPDVSVGTLELPWQPHSQPVGLVRKGGHHNSERGDNECDTDADSESSGHC